MAKSSLSIDMSETNIRLDKDGVADAVKRLTKDKKFTVIATRFEPPLLTHSSNAFRALARAIIHQQLSTKAAATIEQRFILLYHPKKFPTPLDVKNTNQTKLRSVGLSNQKAGYMYDLSEKFIDKTVDPKHFHKMSDAEISEHVIRVKGIGEWSAQMFLIFALNRPNILPTGDLGIQKGAQLFFGLKSLPTPERLRTLATKFDGDHTVFALYLWKLADEAKKKTVKK
jgi:DNA-3-methyladenine glycosylase II